MRAIPQSSSVPILSAPTAPSFEDAFDLAPFGEFLMVEHIKEEERLVQGLHLPEAVKDDWLPRWKVLAVGPGKMLADGSRAKPLVKTGDIIILAPRGELFEVKARKARTAFIQEQSIIAIVSERQSLQ